MSGGKEPIRYLSLAAKAGRIVIGGDDIEKSIRQKRSTGLLILADDAAPNAVRRAGSWGERPGIEVYQTHYSKSELASAVGRGSSVALALLTDRGLAAAFLAAVKGLEQEEQP